MDRIHGVVGEHRRLSLLRTLDGPRWGRACQAGLETGTHTGEAVPCRWSVCDEYALARASASQSGATHVLSTGCGGSRANASRKQSIGLCYTPGLLSPPRPDVVLFWRGRESPRRSRVSREPSSSSSHSPLAIVRCQPGVLCPAPGGLLGPALGPAASARRGN